MRRESGRPLRTRRGAMDETTLLRLLLLLLLPWRKELVSLVGRRLVVYTVCDAGERKWRDGANVNTPGTPVKANHTDYVWMRTSFPLGGLGSGSSMVGCLVPLSSPDTVCSR
jgi:hypothetical protein